MTYIDTHAHLYADQFDDDRTEMIQRAIDQGVQKILLPNINLDSIDGMESLTKQFPEVCYSMMGIHPCDVKENWEDQLATAKTRFLKGKHIAIGEIGIDLYWDKSLKKEQTAAFTEQIRWAKEESLPIVIHCRESFDEIFEVIDKENDESLFGIFHCFTGTENQAQKILEYGGFKLGIGGVVTFKNSGLDKVLKNVSPDYLVLETDAPYLAPSPHRGKRNESSYIPLIAEKLASIYGLSKTEIGQITTKNALEIFQLNE
ncbi:MAG: TatD family hydrolase [Brumimicrobium sp.]|nr:TatD family hydrolase [Brumimicrobium sp.]